MSPVEPSEYVPVAVNCWVEPTIKLAGDAGVTAIEDNVGVLVVVAATIIVKGTDGLVIPFRDAVMLAVPAVTPLAKPKSSIVAIAVESLVHVTSELMSAVVPSEYVPVAVNCWVEPTAKLACEAGVTAMEDNVGVLVVAVVIVVEDEAFDEHAVAPKVRAVINPMIRKYPINFNCLLFISIFPPLLN
jgi:hypothetical protein